MPSPLEQVISALDQFDNVELAYIRSVAAFHMKRSISQTSPIFKLPRELRDEIYHHLAFAFFKLHTSEGASTQDSLALLRVNKQIHSEFINVFYGSTYFRGLLIDEVTDGQQLSATLPLKLVQKIIERRGGREAAYIPKRNVLMATFKF